MKTEIPDLYSFEVPEDATILSAAKGIPKYPDCEKKLTDKNFYSKSVKGPKAGGFIPMSKTRTGLDFKAEDAIAYVGKLARETRRNFRIGTALEALLFFRQNRSACPKCFVVFGTLWKDGHYDKVLDWGDGREMLNINYSDKSFFSYWEFFIVEDLEP